MAEIERLHQGLDVHDGDEVDRWYHGRYCTFCGLNKEGSS